jgi:acyl carrier protein
MVDSVNRKERNKMKDVENKVRAIIAKHYRISEDDVKSDSSFLTDFDGDSLDIIELVLILEDEFGIEVPEEIAEELDTVQKVYDYINSLNV